MHQSFISAYADVLKQGIREFLREEFNIASGWGFSPADITVETRLWHGKKDNLVPIECSEYLAMMIPSSSATYIEGVGHYFSFEQWPKLLQAIIAE